MATLGDLDDIRNGLAKALTDAIDGLRATPDTGTAINPPMAIIGFPDPILYDEDADGDTLAIPVTVLLSTTDSRSANLQLTKYLARDGVESIRRALETDTTLEGACMSLRVKQARAPGYLDSDNVTYLTCTWDVEIFA